MTRGTSPLLDEAAAKAAQMGLCGSKTPPKKIVLSMADRVKLGMYIKENEAQLRAANMTATQIVGLLAGKCSVPQFNQSHLDGLLRSMGLEPLWRRRAANAAPKVKPLPARDLVAAVVALHDALGMTVPPSLRDYLAN